MCGEEPLILFSKASLFTFTWIHHPITVAIIAAIQHAAATNQVAMRWEFLDDLASLLSYVMFSWCDHVAFSGVYKYC